MQCHECKHWDNSVQPSDKDSDEYGVCRFSPPVADDRTHHARWPFTADTDHCASFSEIDHSDIYGRLARAEREVRDAKGTILEWEKWYSKLHELVPADSRKDWPKRPTPTDDIPF